MEKNHQAKSGSMLTQKTNEDYNKKSPSQKRQYADAKDKRRLQ
jgi:hypothetical protein